jgi:hypothetical protein
MAAYTRCLRCAGAPKRPASGSGLSLLIPSRHAVLSDPGEFDIGLRRMTTGSALPTLRNPFHAGGRFRGFTGSLPLQPARLLAPLYGSDWNAQPSGTFTSRLSTDRSPSPLLDITTTATGLLLLAGLSPAGMAASLAARSIATDGFRACAARCPLLLQERSFKA